MFGIMFGIMWLFIVFVIGVVCMNDKAKAVKKENTTETDSNADDDFYKYDNTEEHDSGYKDIEEKKMAKEYSSQFSTIALLLAVIVLMLLFKN